MAESRERDLAMHEEYDYRCRKLPVIQMQLQFLWAYYDLMTIVTNRKFVLVNTIELG